MRYNRAMSAHDQSIIKEVHDLIASVRSKADLDDVPVLVGLLTERRDGRVSQAVRGNSAAVLTEGILTLDHWSEQDARGKSLICDEDVHVSVSPA